MNDGLKNCGHCNSMAEYRTNDEGEVAAWCSCCGIHTAWYPKGEIDQAKAVWNDRAIDPDDYEMTCEANKSMASRLDEICLVVKGKPPPNVAYSWHDLADIVAELKKKAG
jgi:hypothetical protein